MSLDPRAALRLALSPRSIAVIGASDNPNKIGGRPLAYLARFGFEGVVYPVNPMRKEVQGFVSYPSFASLPAVPDIAIVALAGELAVAAVDECAQAGVALCIVMSSGFGESDTAGLRTEKAMTARARACGMRIVGPNSQGLANFGSGAIASFSTMFSEVAPADGPIGIISQSGAMSVIPYGLLRKRGYGVRHSHATGNDADVTVCELATVVAEDPALKLLLLYLEGIPDPWHLAEAARIARERKLAIVVLKSGRSSAGQKAALSHTGALANEDRTVDAFFQEHGIWRVNSMAEMIDMAPLYLQGWRPKGRRLVAISNSGAVCVLAADAASEQKMPMEALSSVTQEALKKILPTFATTNNPVDITAALLSNSRLLGDILPPIAKDSSADAFLIGIAVAGAGYDVQAFARDTAGFANQTGKPVVIAAPQDSVAEQFKAHDLIVFPTEAQAVRALGQYLSHAELLAETVIRNPIIKTAQAGFTVPHRLDEAVSLALLAKNKIPVVKYEICLNLSDVLKAVDSFGGKSVVLKGCTAEVSHKSELGLVHLGIKDAQSASTAFEAITTAALNAGLFLSGVIVAEMLSGQRELMIGARVDAVFGPVVLIGDGGKYVEAMPDLQVLLPPFSALQVEQALRRLKIAPLLDGVRGEPALDVQAFCEAAVAVGKMMTEPDSTITQLDINPIIVRAKGQGCFAVDAVVFCAERSVIL